MWRKGGLLIDVKYTKGTQVKIDTTTRDNCGWSALSCMEHYPDAVFTVTDYKVQHVTELHDDKQYMNRVHYIIETEPRFVGATYRYEVREHNLISLQEIRDRKINHVLDGSRN